MKIKIPPNKLYGTTKEFYNLQPKDREDYMKKALEQLKHSSTSIEGRAKELRKFRRGE
jgi:hypothetical protein